MATSERKRAKNLTNEDIELFTALVFQFKGVIENKKTDAVTVKQKNEAWESIAVEFSASASHPRNAEQLRNYYKNTKSQMKKELAKEKVEQFLTGGGSATNKKIKDTPLMQIVQPEITPLSNPYDSSSAYFNDYSQPSTSRSRTVRDKHQEAYEEYIRLGGDPAWLGDDVNTPRALSDSPETPDPTHEVDDAPTIDLATPALVASGAPSPAVPATPAPTVPAIPAPTVPATPASAPPVTPASGVIRNNKRQRINFNSLREYVGEFGELKKRKYELQNKVLELQIKKLERELNTQEE